MSCRRSREDSRPFSTISREAAELPEHGASLQTASPYLKFETIQEGSNNISPITPHSLSLGCETPNSHPLCLQCFGAIDQGSCRSVDQGWGIGWHCGTCGDLKLSKEMRTTFLMGASTIRTLEPSQIRNYAVQSFPWLEDSREGTGLHQLYMQVACVAQRGGMSLREALGGADFFGYPGIFDVLARAWCEQRAWQFIAIRLQGVILLRHDKKRSNYGKRRNEVKQDKRTNIPAPIRNDDRKVMHFRLAKSELRTNTGRSQSITVLVEHDLTEDGEPIVHSTPGTTMKQSSSPGLLEKNSLGRLIRMKLTGVHLINHTYHDKKIEAWTLDTVRSIVDGERELEQRSWDFLSETLSRIQDCLQRDGEYCIIKLGQNKPSSGRPAGVITVENKGPIDPNSLRDDFRRAFHI